MTHDDLVAHFGTSAAAAAALKTDRQRLQGWKNNGGRVPLEAQIEYEVLTHGALRADLPAEVRNNPPEERSAA